MNIFTKQILLPITTFALLSACSLSFSMDIFYAIKTNDIKKAQELIEVDKINVNKCDAQNNSPLCFACRDGSAEIVELLLAHNANIDCNSCKIAKNGNPRYSCDCDYDARYNKILLLLKLVQDYNQSQNKTAFIETQAGYNYSLLIQRQFNSREKQAGLSNKNKITKYSDCSIETTSY